MLVFFNSLIGDIVSNHPCPFIPVWHCNIHVEYINSANEQFWLKPFKCQARIFFQRVGCQAEDVFTSLPRCWKWQKKHLEAQMKSREVFFCVCVFLVLLHRVSSQFSSIISSHNFSNLVSLRFYSTLQFLLNEIFF